MCVCTFSCSPGKKDSRNVAAVIGVLAGLRHGTYVVGSCRHGKSRKPSAVSATMAMRYSVLASKCDQAQGHEERGKNVPGILFMYLPEYTIRY